MIGKKINEGRALYYDGKYIWVAKGLTFYGIDKQGKCITQKYKVGGPISRLFSNNRITRQFLRIGIHHLLPLKNDGFLVTLKRKTLILDKNGKILNVFSGYSGNKPGHKGVCITPEGTIFFAEYSVNISNQRPTSLYRSIDNGISFQNIFTFQKDVVQHIHFVQWDKYENCIWMGTGDKDFECRLLRSSDNGDSWETIGKGSQLWRAVGITFVKNTIYWGTDAGSVLELNYIMKMDRVTHQISRVQEVQGPCHGNAVLADATVYISTGIEGGQNEKDNCAHLWMCEESGRTTEIMQIEKDIFPHIVQYGVIRFPMGLEDSDVVIYTTYALKGNGEAVYIDC